MSQASNLQLNAACVQLDVQASDWEEAIRNACQPLIDGGFVTPAYPDDVIERERQWATGLPTVPVAVAIPHALKADNVRKAQIAACRLKTPVGFRQSGGTPEDEDVAVSLLFILALDSPKEQLSLLQKLMLAISDEEMLASLLTAEDEENFSALFNGTAAGC